MPGVKTIAPASPDPHALSICDALNNIFCRHGLCWATGRKLTAYFEGNRIMRIGYRFRRSLRLLLILLVPAAG
jgi:hypothetical protein